MNTIRLLLGSLALLAGTLLVPATARAAESFDNCTDFIDSVPTTISTQGVWCLRHDVGTGIGYGNAIAINANNVTLDCNDFKLGGLAAGNASNATGIFAYQRKNITIRNCSVRGFRYGILLSAGAGHLVEDNLLDNNLSQAIRIFNSDNVMVRRNRVFDTGGLAGNKWTTAISADAHVIDNTISGLYADVSGGYLRGIDTVGNGLRVSGNHISGFDMTAVQGGAVDYANGIFVAGQYLRVSGNHVSVVGGSSGGGSISVNGGSNVFCVDNTVGGFDSNLFQCTIADGNLILP